MQKSVILVFVAVLSAMPLLAQSGDSSSVTKPSTRRTWTLSELDTLSTHKWVWRDPSFKEVVLQTPDSLPDELPYVRKSIAFNYPERAREQRLEADVLMRVLIDRKGKVRTAYAQMDSGHEDIGFEEAALKVARENRWEPAYLHNESIAVWVTYKNRFRLLATSSGAPVSKVSRWEWWIEEEEAAVELTGDTLTEQASAKRDAPDKNEFIPFEKTPEAIKLANPIYPQAALSSRVQSTVQVKVLVDKRGNVRCATIMIPSDRPGYGFEESALAAAIEGIWKPAEQDGKPIAVWVTYPIKYLLR